MRLGYYTDYSEETAAFASETGFTSLELSAWPDSAINPDTVSEGRLEQIRADLQGRDIEISALGYYPNYLAPEAEERAESKRYFLKVLDLAQRMEVPVVCTFVGRNPYCTVEENMGPFPGTLHGVLSGSRGTRPAHRHRKLPDGRTQDRPQHQPGLQPGNMGSHV